MTQCDTPVVSLDVLLYRERECWVAHCLQLDLVTSSPDLATVEDDIVKICRTQVLFAYEDDCLDGLLRPPNPEISAQILRALDGEGLESFFKSLVADNKRLDFRMFRKAA